ncbi:MAG: hypothetical protein F6J92_23010 [Symploca sp. SIO1A3]|nr:hypothetical protein [Symploca sp. SIO1A3]
MNSSPLDDIIDMVNAEIRASTGETGLTHVQEIVLRGSLERDTYKEIAANNRDYSRTYIQNQVGWELWTRLSEVFGEDIRKTNCWYVLPRLCKQINATSVPLEENIQSPNDPELSPLSSTTRKLDTASEQLLRDWGQVPDISGFCGREPELKRLQREIVDGCRLITLFGTVRIGKTWLAVKLAQKIRDQYTCLIWRSLDLNPPPLMQDLLKDLIQVISGDKETKTDLSYLVDCLLNQHCLIILDGFESVLQSGVHDGSYRSGYEDYREFLEKVGKAAHQSCVILTSREHLQDIELMKDQIPKVFSLKIDGFGESTIQRMLVPKGLYGSDGDWRALSSRYEGNPTVLTAVAKDVKLFDGNITAFLNQPNLSIPSVTLYLFEKQFQRLSQLEQEIIQFLSNYHEPPLFNDLVSALRENALKTDIREASKSLMRRNIIHLRKGRYFVGRLMAAYIQDCAE